MRGRILILGLICFFVLSFCNKQLPTSPDIPDIEPRILACVEVVRDSVKCQRGLYNEAGDEVLNVWGRVKNVGGETAYSVMVKVMLFDPVGNFLAEEYATFYSDTFLGTEIDISQHEEFVFICRWLIKENLEMIEQFNIVHNPYRPDRDPAKCIVITWDN